MKHSRMVTFILIVGFILAQVIGLVIVNKYVDWQATKESGEVVWKPLPSVGGVPVERPQVEESYVIWWFALMIAITTVIFFFVIKVPVFWKVWYFAAIFTCLFIAFNALVPYYLAIILALVCAFFRLRQNFIVHNLSELFMYGGLAAIFVDVIGSILNAFLLLILISLYDMYSVWKSKHMIKMAKSQTKAGVFAGMMIPYSFSKPSAVVHKSSKVSRKQMAEGRGQIAILGGGDVGFPLLFTGVVFKFFGWSALTIVPFSALSLFLLFYYADKNKFYPAMPFLSIGCFVGFLVLKIFTGF